MAHVVQLWNPKSATNAKLVIASVGRFCDHECRVELARSIYIIYLYIYIYIRIEVYVYNNPNPTYIYTVYTRYVLQGNHWLYGHIRFWPTLMQTAPSIRNAGAPMLTNAECSCWMQLQGAPMFTNADCSFHQKCRLLPCSPMQSALVECKCRVRAALEPHALSGLALDVMASSFAAAGVCDI